LLPQKKPKQFNNKKEVVLTFLEKHVDFLLLVNEFHLLLRPSASIPGIAFAVDSITNNSTEATEAKLLRE
jgi:hypothetical protein